MSLRLRLILATIFTIIISIIIVSKREYFYRYDIYHYVKNILNNDKPLEQFYNQFPKGTIYQNNNLINQNHQNIKLIWTFRPEFVAPVYPYVLLHDVNNDKIKEVYYASNTEYLYEIDGSNGEVLRSYKIPRGVFSVKGNLLYKNKDNNTFFLGNSGQSLPITSYSFKLDEKKIKVNWSRFLKGQFVEASINKVNLFDSTNFLILTRDATYSRGKVHLLNIDGEIVYKSEEIADVCDLRPSITKDNAFIYGSHDYLSHEYSNHIIKKDLVSGKTIWKKKFNHDTGFFTPIILNEFDNSYSILIHNLDNKVIELNGKNGEIKKVLNNVNIEGITTKFIISNRFEDNGSFVDFINIDDHQIEFSLKHSSSNKNSITEHFFIFENNVSIEYHGFSFDAQTDILSYKKFINDDLVHETKIPLKKINFNKNKYENSTRDFTGISKLGDIDNNNKLDVLFRVYDHLLRFELNSEVRIDYDYEVHPHDTQDALIF